MADEHGIARRSSHGREEIVAHGNAYGHWTPTPLPLATAAPGCPIGDWRNPVWNTV